MLCRILKSQFLLWVIYVLINEVLFVCFNSCLLIIIFLFEDRSLNRPFFDLPQFWVISLLLQLSSSIQPPASKTRVCLAVRRSTFILFFHFEDRGVLSWKKKSFQELHREASTTAACTVFVLWVSRGVWINIVIMNITAHYDSFNKYHQYESYLSGDTNDH